MIKKLIKLADILDANGLEKEARAIDIILATRSKRSREGLIIVADSLDKKGLHKEASYLDAIIKQSGFPTREEAITEDMREDAEAGVSYEYPDFEEAAMLPRNKYDRETIQSLLRERTDEELDEDRTRIYRPIDYGNLFDKDNLDDMKASRLPARAYDLLKGMSSEENRDLLNRHKERISRVVERIGHRKGIQRMKKYYSQNPAMSKAILDVYHLNPENYDEFGIIEEVLSYENRLLPVPIRDKMAYISKSITRLADHLDKKGLYKEADYLDNIIKNSGLAGDVQESSKDAGRVRELEVLEDTYVYFNETMGRSDFVITNDDPFVLMQDVIFPHPHDMSNFNNRIKVSAGESFASLKDSPTNSNFPLSTLLKVLEDRIATLKRIIQSAGQETWEDKADKIKLSIGNAVDLLETKLSDYNVSINPNLKIDKAYNLYVPSHSVQLSALIAHVNHWIKEDPAEGIERLKPAAWVSPQELRGSLDMGGGVKLTMWQNYTVTIKELNEHFDEYYKQIMRLIRAAEEEYSY